MEDRYNLERFVLAQGGGMDDVLAELRAGKKVGHWMWYVFPQVIGLGHSSMAKRYAIGSKAEAVAYLNHPLLGARLLECTRAVNCHEGLSAERIFGFPDYLKFRSCMTLFENAAMGENVFSEALERFYDGERDERTLAILSGMGDADRRD